MNKLNHWSARVQGLEKTLIFVLIIASLGCAAYSMITRYLAPQIAFDWVDEMMIYSVVWAIWLAGAQVLTEGDHIRSDFIAQLLIARWGLILRKIDLAICGTFCLICAYGGLQVVLLGLSLQERSDSSLAMPMWIYYAAMPVGFLLTGLRFFNSIVHILKTTPEDET